MWTEENQRVGVPLVAPAAEIHHIDTYWIKNKSLDNEGTKGRETERGENERSRGSEVDKGDATHGEEEEVHLI